MTNALVNKMIVEVLNTAGYITQQESGCVFVRDPVVELVVGSSRLVENGYMLVQIHTMAEADQFLDDRS